VGLEVDTSVSEEHTAYWRQVVYTYKSTWLYYPKTNIDRLGDDTIFLINQKLIFLCLSLAYCRDN
jgi:hypothetical protein